ncbi:cob(I)yrinic acid a,c-diamide adenosyltransferase [Prolixibacter bellariivorans]|uniref:corrinoid adenosyltransferase n=2 Tax=Prolixibacter bellariivorans TaxID=314319 RepID=A0A5M4B5S0_9BACT|nr:cob(I)yrinic acid a,c-diamide adenosyltransferase [Prolixibacter bellariivorans]GET35216.1 cob(I)yrinic acid a,c-diamide adenosyltransferase [Prolixibacter bellariivorans]
MTKRRLIHIYTGEGKGKTTAAVGLATRALGHGLSVCYISFHKDPEVYGYTEIKSLQKLGAEVYSFAKGHPGCCRRIPREALIDDAIRGMEHVEKMVASETFDLVIVDELNIAVRDHFIEEERVLKLIKNKPDSVELVLTGRGATEAVMEAADYVSYIRKIKHPYDEGITSRKGIEF